MAIRLPVLPSAKHVPQVAPVSDPGLQTSSAMFGAAEGGAVEDFGRSTQFVGAQLQQTARRAQARDDAIANARVYQDISAADQEDFTQTVATQNIADKAVLDGLNERRIQRRREALTNYTGSEDGRFQLEEQLIDLNGRYLAQAVDRHNTAAVDTAEAVVNDQANPLIIQLFKQPDRAEQVFAELADVARRTAPVFDSVSEAQLLRMMNDKASAALLEGLQAKPDRAQEALDSLIAGDKISSDLAIAAQRRIDNLRVELDLRAAASSGTGDLVALPDPTSSTGWRFVPKIAGGEAPAPETEGGAKLSDVSSFRGQFNQQSGSFIEVRDAYGRARSAFENPSPAGDLAIIFSYMKALDPSSVVRESEAAAVAATGSFGERLKVAGERLLSGERLTSEMRADFAGQMHNLFQAQLQQQERLQTEWQGIAARSGIDPSTAVPDFIGPSREWQAIAPGDSKKPPVTERIKGEVGKLLSEFDISADLGGAQSVGEAINKLSTAGELDKLPEPVANLMRGVAASDKTVVSEAVRALGVEGYGALPDALKDEVARIMGIE